MYENEIQSVILSRMLDKVNAKFDKREGSIIWDALAPAAVEFENFYYLLTAVLDEVFADTASRPYLIRRCAERGITPKEASPATVRAEFTPTNIELNVGRDRFSHEEFNYIVKKKESDGVYLLECETDGVEPNGILGQLIPIGYVSNLETAYITEIVIPGEDEEDTQSLRNRYMTSLKSEAFGGNKEDYYNKISSIAGVGGVKVYSGSEWNGGGSVKIVFIDSKYDSPSLQFIEEIQEIIDPTCLARTVNGEITENQDPENTDQGESTDGGGSGDGSGDGIAPIGHIVTIIGANTTYVDVELSLDYANGYSWDKVKTDVEAKIDSYFESLNKTWASPQGELRVRISQIESNVLDVPGIIDIHDTTIGTKDIPMSGANIAIDKDSIVKRGNVNVR